MNPPKCDDLDYIQFLIATQTVFTCTEASRVQPGEEQNNDNNIPAHDAFTRLLQRQPPDTEALWQEASKLIRKSEGLLVVDDTTLDKSYAERMDLVTYHWSGKHHRVVRGINLITLLWSDCTALIPCDFRVYNAPVDGLTKNDHFTNMLRTAKESRGMESRYVLFDSWYSGLKNLKLVKGFGWHFLTRLKENRPVNPDRSRNVNVKDVDIPVDGRVVHLMGFGMIKVFRTVSKDGDVDYWATDDLEMNEAQRKDLSGGGWGIEVYHRGLKQCCGAEKSHVRKTAEMISHIHLSLRAFLRLEAHRLKTGVSWYQAKLNIIRDAIRSYLANPTYNLLPLKSTA